MCLLFRRVWYTYLHAHRMHCYTHMDVKRPSGPMLIILHYSCCPKSIHQQCSCLHTHCVQGLPEYSGSHNRGWLSWHGRERARYPSSCLGCTANAAGLIAAHNDRAYVVLPGPCILTVVVWRYCVGVDPLMALRRLWDGDIGRHKLGLRQHHACLRVCGQARLQNFSFPLYMFLPFSDGPPTTADLT